MHSTERKRAERIAVSAGYVPDQVAHLRPARREEPAAHPARARVSLREPTRVRARVAAVGVTGKDRARVPAGLGNYDRVQGPELGERVPALQDEAAGVGAWRGRVSMVPRLVRRVL